MSRYVYLLLSVVCLSIFKVSCASAAEIKVNPVELVRPGNLYICADFPAPPQEMYSEGGEPQGTDVEVGKAIAKSLKLKPVWVNTVFDTIILAVKSGKCDLVITGMMITPSRVKQIDLIPYFTGGQQLLVLKGNPERITSDGMSLCGKTVAVDTGTLEQQTAQQYSKGCVAANKAAVNLLSSNNISVCLQQLMTGRAAAFFADSAQVEYYAHLHPDKLEIAGESTGVVSEGIGLAQGHPTLKAGVIATLKEIESDGQYKAILKKWGLGATELPKPE